MKWRQQEHHNGRSQQPCNIPQFRRQESFRPFGEQEHERDRSRRDLKRCLEEPGLDVAEALEALGWPEAELAVDYGVAEGGDGGTRPSNGVEAEGEEER